MIIAHRGYAKFAPENTIAAFRSAMAAGADAIETDVRLAAGGALVVHHDPLRGTARDALLGSDLFDYIQSENIPAYLELKSNSEELFSKVVLEIEKRNLWETVHLIGFFNNIGAALRGQARYPKLKVCQLLLLPALSRLVPPKKSYAVFVGWLDAIAGSERLFRTFISQGGLARLKQFYERKGFRVYGGVLNHEDGMRYFHEAGIDDIFTDEVELAVRVIGEYKASSNHKSIH